VNLDENTLCLALGVNTKIMVGAKQYSDQSQVFPVPQVKLFFKINEIIFGGIKNTLYICKRNKGRKK
jgi:hypothetical protein